MIAEIGPLRHGQLADDHRAGRAQPRDNRRVVCRAKVTKDGGAGRGRGVDRVAEILHADRYAVQDTLVVAARVSASAARAAASAVSGMTKA